MEPTTKWIDDWKIGVKPSREDEFSAELFGYFIHFWNKEKLSDRSKTTINRYSTALHALGGYLVEQAISSQGLNKTAYELLSECISPNDGPLIYDQDKNWQYELDMVCRKLYKHMKKNR